MVKIHFSSFFIFVKYIEVDNGINLEKSYENFLLNLKVENVFLLENSMLFNIIRKNNLKFYKC